MVYSLTYAVFSFDGTRVEGFTRRGSPFAFGSPLTGGGSVILYVCIRTRRRENEMSVKKLFSVCFQLPMQAHFTDHGGDVMSVSILPSVDKNVFVSGSCDSLAKVRSGRPAVAPPPADEVCVRQRFADATHGCRTRRSVCSATEGAVVLFLRKACCFVKATEGQARQLVEC